MKNVTIVLEEKVARWIRVRAAEEETSVSRLVGDLLRQMMEDDQQYDRSREAFSSVETRRLRKRGEAMPARGAVHERGVR